MKKGSLIVALLAATEFFFVLFKVTGVGDVKTWSWPTVLIPFWIWCGLYVIFLIRLAVAIFRQGRGDSKFSAPEGRVEAFFRERRARKYQRDREKWGTAK